MCLDRVDKTTKDGTKYAYKVFKSVNGEYHNFIYHPLFLSLLAPTYDCLLTVLSKLAKPYKIGRWYTSSKRKICGCNKTKYPSGFHCFADKSAALTYIGYFGDEVVIKVEVEDIVASGVQEGWDRYGKSKSNQVIVARRMKPLEGCCPSS
jgi:hypothetical protein